MPVYIKVIIALFFSVVIHTAFEYLLYFGFFNYLKYYQIPFFSYSDFDVTLLFPYFYYELVLTSIGTTSVFIAFYFLLNRFKLNSNKKYFFSNIIIIFTNYSFMLMNLIFRRKNSLTDMEYKKGTLELLNRVFSGRKKFDLFIFIITALIFCFYFIVSAINNHIIMYISILFIFPLFFSILIIKIFKEYRMYILILGFSFSFFVSSLSILTVHSIENKLERLSIGGNIRTTLIFKDNTTFDGYLLFMNNKNITLFDINKLYIKTFKYSDVKEINKKFEKDKYKYDGISQKEMLF